MDASDSENASVVGPLCTPLDLLADRMEFTAAQPRDLVALFQSSAYGSGEPAKVLEPVGARGSTSLTDSS